MWGVGGVHSEMLAGREEEGWTVKSKTAAAGYKEASAGITHSQKLLCSPECRQTGASPNTGDQIHPAALLSSPSIPSDIKERPPAVKHSRNKLAFLTGEDKSGVALPEYQIKQKCIWSTKVVEQKVTWLLPTHAVQQNISRTHTILFSMLVEIQKFIQIPNLSGRSVGKYV